MMLQKAERKRYYTYTLFMLQTLAHASTRKEIHLLLSEERIRT